MPLSPRQITLLYIHARTKVQYKELREGLSKYMSEDTMHGHLDDLIEEELVWKAFEKIDHTYPKYFVTKRGLGEVKNILNDREFDEHINQMSEAEVKKTLKDILHSSI
jgi:DNA-binding MarR family transcriptional regulator